MQFGDDISSECGDQVRHLILALVNSVISTEEFHAKLQEATNFPLRPFVIPFLKTNLPFLQRELMHCAGLARQFPDRYLSIPEASVPPTFDGSFGQPAPKRSAPNIPIPQEQLIPPFHRTHLPQVRSEHPKALENTLSENPKTSKLNQVERIGTGETNQSSKEGINTKPIEEEKEKSILKPEFSNEMTVDAEREIYYVFHLLSTVSVMMEKARQSLNIVKKHGKNIDNKDGSLQQRGMNEGSSNCLHGVIKEVENAISAAEDQSADLISDVEKQRSKLLKRKLSGESEKALPLPPTISSSTLALALTSVDAHSKDDFNCWNCGREAHETCSGCNKAKYCGPFCQHKDWENHHKCCSKLSIDMTESHESDND